MDYPAPITRYLLNRNARNRHLAYFHLDVHARILDLKGLDSPTTAYGWRPHHEH